MSIACDPELQEWVKAIAARTSKGIYVHQATCKINPPEVGDIVVDKEMGWLVFLVHKVFEGYAWYGQDPQTVEGDPEDPCDEDFMKDISS